VFYLALVPFVDEVGHLRALVPQLRADGLQVLLISNGAGADALSGVRALAARAGAGVVERSPEPEFDLAALLSDVYARAADSGADWAVLNAPDEWLQSRSGDPLSSMLDRAADDGANVVNFEEFVFLPPPECTVPAEDARATLSDYYFFAPRHKRLMRAWRPADGIADPDGAGHHFSGSDVHVWHEDGILRHYPVLGTGHAQSKYLQRTYAPTNLAKGWHKNRLGLGPADLEVTHDSPHLRRLPSPDSRAFDRSGPARVHYWDQAWRDGAPPNWVPR
jgi:hypothetical protein